jgi:hypothetical protein
MRLLAAAVLLLAAPSWAQSPHVPTEKELDRRLSGVKHRADDVREYQAHSTESFMSNVRGAAQWVKTRLASLHITPARLALGLGILGVVFTWSRNKRHVKWAVLTVASWLLVVFGVAAIIFRWPYAN